MYTPIYIRLMVYLIQADSLFPVSHFTVVSKRAPDGLSRDAGLDLFCLRHTELEMIFRGIRESKRGKRHSRHGIGP